MHFPSDTKNNNNVPSNGVETHRKINFSTISLFNHKKTLPNLKCEILKSHSNFFFATYVLTFLQRAPQTDCELRLIYTTAYGLRSLKYFALNIWNIVPIDIRNSDSLK